MTSAFRKSMSAVCLMAVLMPAPLCGASGLCGTSIKGRAVAATPVAAKVSSAQRHSCCERQGGDSANSSDAQPVVPHGAPPCQGSKCCVSAPATPQGARVVVHLEPQLLAVSFVAGDDALLGVIAAQSESLILPERNLQILLCTWRC